MVVDENFGIFEVCVDYYYCVNLHGERDVLTGYLQADITNCHLGTCERILFSTEDKWHWVVRHATSQTSAPHH